MLGVEVNESGEGLWSGTWSDEVVSELDFGSGLSSGLFSGLLSGLFSGEREEGASFFSIEVSTVNGSLSFGLNVGSGPEEDSLPLFTSKFPRSGDPARLGFL